MDSNLLVVFSSSKAERAIERGEGIVQKKDITPVHYQWSYVFLALTHRYAV